MIIPDVNLLLYSIFDRYPEHEAARRWWESALNADEPIGFVPVVLTGFVRLATKRQVMRAPLDVAAAVTLTREWMNRPQVQVLSTSRSEISVALNLIAGAGAAGNLTTGALIAAHATRHRATVYSNDTDFARFPEVKWVNPLRR